MKTMTTMIDLLAYAIGLISRLYEWDEPRVWRFLSERESMQVVSDLLCLYEIDGSERIRCIEAIKAGLAARGLHVPLDHPVTIIHDELTHERIRELARRGMTVKQMADKFGVGRETVRQRYRKAMVT